MKTMENVEKVEEGEIPPPNEEQYEEAKES